VRGSTTSSLKLEMLSEAGIDPFLISLAESSITGNLDGFIRGLNTLIINIPPNLRDAQKESYISKIQHLAPVIQNTSLINLIFISSTSVYGNIQGSVTEE